MAIFASLLVLFAAIVFATRRLLRYLHIFQQEEYDGRRFLKWLFTDAAFDKKLTAALLLLVLAARSMNIGWICLEHRARRRIPRLCRCRAGSAQRRQEEARPHRARHPHPWALPSCSPSSAALDSALQFGGRWWWIAFVQLIPFTLVVGNWLLTPYEKRIQDGFRQRAEARLAKLTRPSSASPARSARPPSSTSSATSCN